MHGTLQYLFLALRVKVVLVGSSNLGGPYQANGLDQRSDLPKKRGIFT